MVHTAALGRAVGGGGQCGWWCGGDADGGTHTKVGRWWQHARKHWVEAATRQGCGGEAGGGQRRGHLVFPFDLPHSHHPNGRSQRRPWRARQGVGQARRRHLATDFRWCARRRRLEYSTSLRPARSCPPPALDAPPHHTEFHVVIGISSRTNSRWWLVDPACRSSSLLDDSSIPRRNSRRVPPGVAAAGTIVAAELGFAERERDGGEGRDKIERGWD